MRFDMIDKSQDSYANQVVTQALPKWTMLIVEILSLSSDELGFEVRIRRQNTCVAIGVFDNFGCFYLSITYPSWPTMCENSMQGVVTLEYFTTYLCYHICHFQLWVRNLSKVIENVIPKSINLLDMCLLQKERQSLLPRWQYIAHKLQSNIINIINNIYL